MGAAAAAVALRRPREGPPTYRPVSFHRGSIGNARFALDGKTILYSAAWEGKPPQIFSTRLDSTESTALPFPSADLLSISAAGKLAILVLHGSESAAIAEVSLAGGAPRELVVADPPEALQFSQQIADYAPGGERLAVVRNGQLEFPIGKVLVPAAPDGQVAAIRFLGDDKQIAYSLENRSDNMALGVVDLSGHRKILTSGWEIISSIAWNPVAREIWFSGRRKTNHIGVVELHAVSLSGKERLVAQNPQLIIVQDIAPDGRVLARSDDWPETMMCLPPGAKSGSQPDLARLFPGRGAVRGRAGPPLRPKAARAPGQPAAYTCARPTARPRRCAWETGLTDRQDLSPDKKWIVQAQPGPADPASGRLWGAEDHPGQGFSVPPGAVVPGRQAPARFGVDPGPRAADVRARPGAGTAPADHAQGNALGELSRDGRASSS